MQESKTEIKEKIQSGKLAASILTPTSLKSSNYSLYIQNTFISLSLYLISFWAFFFFKRDTFVLPNEYIKFLSLLMVSVIAATILSNKYNLTAHHTILEKLRKIYISFMLGIGILTGLTILSGNDGISRMIFFGSMMTGFSLEVLYHSIFSNRLTKDDGKTKRFNTSSLLYLAADGLILALVCYFHIVRYISTASLNDKHYTMLVVFFLSWIISAVLTHNFNPVLRSKDKWHSVGVQIKFYMLIASFILAAVYLLEINPLNRGHFIIGLIEYSILSFIIFSYLFLHRIKIKTDEVTSVFLKTFDLRGPANHPFAKRVEGKYKFESEESSESVLKQKLKSSYLTEFQEVFEFVDREIDLKSFDSRKSLIIRSSDPYNINVLPDDSQQMIVNLHVINDIRQVNDYFRSVNKKLLKNGVYIGCLHPLKYRYSRFYNNYPFFFAAVLYGIDFIVKRAVPKLPVIRKIYFALSKGKDRAISLAEGLGRLVYCGFEILDLAEIENTVWFAVRKVRASSTVSDPWYSTVFRMKRLGKDGKTIYVYKFRTMHPYSEFIQEMVYSVNSLQEGGKFKDDFRVTSWGRLMRKLWLDEWPMLINLVKGDLKLVGVRPISNQYASLYSPEHQQSRLKFKPGLVPPFYADLPKTIEEIEESERRYLEAYEKNPIKTDIKYFFKIANNIFIKRKRSA